MKIVNILSLKIWLLIFVLLICCSFTKKKVPEAKFKFNSFKLLKNIPEPSDIVWDKETNTYYIVSDHGFLYECDLTGKIIRKAGEGGLDFEGVEVKDSFIYVSDETPRKVFKYKKSDLSLVKEYQVSFSGAMNKAFESITYNYTKNCFVLVSQQPISICEYDDKFHFIERYSFHNATDISSARWYKGELYLLSGFDEMIYKVDANEYKLIEQYKINVYNPEGLAFDKDGNVTMTSDKLQRIYFFNNIPIIK